MSHSKFLKLIALFLLPFIVLNSCADLFNLPQQGTLTGFVTDKLTGEPIPNVLIIADYVEPNETGGIDRQQQFFTTDEGFFRLENIWDEARIVTERKGFQSLHFFFVVKEGDNETVSLQLLGNPILFDHFFDELEISQSKAETTELRAEVEDLYNDDIHGDFRVFVFFTNIADGHAEAGFTLEQVVKSDHFANFRVEINANEFPALHDGEKFELRYLIEIEDPDGNVHDYFSTDSDPHLVVTP